MTAVIAALAITVVVFGLIVLWLAWDRAEQAETRRELEDAVAEMRRARDCAIAERDTAGRHGDEWREVAGTYQRMAEEAGGAEQRLTDLRLAARILPSLSDAADLRRAGPGVCGMSTRWITLPAPTLIEVDPDDMAAAIEQREAE